MVSCLPFVEVHLNHRSSKAKPLLLTNTTSWLRYQAGLVLQTPGPTARR